MGEEPIGGGHSRGLLQVYFVLNVEEREKRRKVSSAEERDGIWRRMQGGSSTEAGVVGNW